MTAPISSAPAVANAPQTAEQLLNAWTAALNAADVTALAGLYADKVKFYGQSLTREEVLARKRKALAATPGFSQQVLGQPSYQDEDDSVRVGFQKRSGSPAALSDVRSTLVLVKSPRLAIREETDAVTEKRFSSAGGHAKPDSCEAAVWALVDSTPFAKQLNATIEQNLKRFSASEDLHLGGMGPFLPSETGGTYELWIGVHHPGRFENYAVFSVSPKGATTVACGQCDAPRGPISPTRSALDDFNRLCASH
ncbi:MAG TPA: hypothetical protein VJV79_13130 [Polyangiaceae bacterium]|nr:hypothetical protein [Polyangiaceae bacterium]